MGEGFFDIVGLCTLGLHWRCLSAQGISTFLNKFYWFGVAGLCTLGLNWGRVHLHWVYSYFSIGSTGLVQ